jgi:hypothetical protein
MDKRVRNIKTAITINEAAAGFDGIGVVGADGVSLATLSDFGSETMEVRPEDALLSSALTGLEAIGTVIEETEDGLSLRLTAAVPLRNEWGVIIGALWAGHEINDEFLGEIRSSHQDTHMVLIHEGQFLAHSWTEEDRISTMKAILSDIQTATNATVMATEEGTKGVDDGMQLAVQAGEAIGKLGAVIDESAQAATQVVAGGRQQVAGVEQIALAMQNINHATAQSIATTRQAEKAA